MSKLPNDSTSAGDGNKRSRRSDGLYLIASMADTTWRLFIPTLGLLLSGNALDDKLHTHPWLMLAGAILGGWIAAVLIKRQIAKGNDSAK
ncbi:MAG TPA: hypothetical protein VLF64_00250 [Candidatus Saccharimonadales bacterium]|nr:hypothetical protein [Candidatus Saccharimonadales bacterium]